MYNRTFVLRIFSRVILSGVCIALLDRAALAQDQKEYILGESQRLQMRVYIMGEVKEPGEYLVQDDTDVLELVSKAGGPTEYGNLRAVLIRRAHRSEGLATAGTNGDPQPDVLDFDLRSYLEAKDSTAPPRLYPGDVVSVPSNSWRTWRRVFSVVRDVSVVASAYFLYLRANK